MKHSPNTARIAGAVTVFALATSLIAGCAADPADAPRASGHAGHAAPSTSVAAAANFSAADVEFATMMYPHHAQAVQMADLVTGRDAGPDVTKLAAQIRGAQQPEMDAFARLLKAWGQPAPSAQTDHAMDGMMTAAELDHLRTLRGAEFDQAWLKMMIAHHEGAITMARAELAAGKNAEARGIAEQIITGQQAEIATMRKLIG